MKRIGARGTNFAWLKAGLAEDETWLQHTPTVRLEIKLLVKALTVRLEIKPLVKALMDADPNLLRQAITNLLSSLMTPVKAS